jgi:hypothetical protein
VAFPRSLKVVRDQADIAQAAALAASGPVPHAREAGALLTAIATDYGARVGMNTRTRSALSR